jgi:flagella basal body P-ring formation protein FlgA
MLDSERVHIRLSVICLQNGAPGQMIRVTGKDRKLVFTAQVIDGGLLKGRL